jgi:hypothetical protein
MRRINRRCTGNRKNPAAGSCVEFENIPILNDVCALYHQTVVLMRLPKEACVSQMLGEVAMNMRGCLLHSAAAPQ